MVSTKQLFQEHRVCKFSDGSISEIHLTCPSHCTRQFSIQYDEDITKFDKIANTFDFTFLADKALRVSKYINLKTHISSIHLEFQLFFLICQ